MNKQLMIGLIVGVVVIAGTGYFYMTKDISITSDTATSTTTSVDGARSLAELINSTEAVKCSVAHKTEISDTTGVVYVSGGKIRGEYTSKATATGQNYSVHTVLDGQNGYVWIDGVPVGFKAPWSVINTRTISEDSQVPDINQKLAYDCSPWNTDASVFTVPTNIQFTAVQ